MTAAQWTPAWFAFVHYGSIAVAATVAGILLGWGTGRILHLWDWEEDDQLHVDNDSHRLRYPSAYDTTAHTTYIIRMYDQDAE